MSDLPRTAFLGRGISAVSWYRCALPAMALGLDWLGTGDDPVTMPIVTGLRPDGPLEFVADRYDVIVVELVAGHGWRQRIQRWQAEGKVVLYDVDDWIRGVRRNKHHAFNKTVTKKAAEEAELCMAVCDGIICSTPWLARRYASVNPRTFVCRNGIDLRRYRVTRPQRSSVAIGWAGATGHGGAMALWMPGVAEVMRRHADTRFVSIGQPFGGHLRDEFGAQRTMDVPFSSLDTYPATMALLDVALAPAGKGNFFRGKSDLRWLEASALGIPLIADPEVYPDIEHGVTGFHAETPADVAEHLGALVADPELRRRMGAAAHEHVATHRRIEVAATQWADVLREVVAGREPASPVLA